MDGTRYTLFSHLPFVPIPSIPVKHLIVNLLNWRSKILSHTANFSEVFMPEQFVTTTAQPDFTNLNWPSSITNKQ